MIALSSRPVSRFSASPTGYLSLSLAVFFLLTPALFGQTIIVDDRDPDCQLTGVWADNRSNGFSAAGTYKDGYHYTSSHEPFKRTGKEKAIYSPNLPKAGSYKVEVSFRASSGNRSSKVTYEIMHKGGKTSKVVNQKDGSDMTWAVLGTFEFDAGKAPRVAMVSDGGQSASVDAARFTFTAGGGDQTGSLGDILGTPTDSSSDAGSPGGTRIRLDKSTQGQKSFVMPADGAVKITACLSTYGPASLEVTCKTADGRQEELMSWERRDDKDSTPLQIRGKAISSSISQVKPGDFSPIETSETFAASKGDTFMLRLQGRFGSADPTLILESSVGGSADAPASDSGASAPGSGDEQQVSAGGAVKTHLPFDKSWKIAFDGEITSTKGFARLIAGSNETVHGRRIDLWTPSGYGLHFRLCNKKIVWRNASIGSINNPDGESDHFLKAKVQVKPGKCSLLIEHDAAAQQVTISFNGDVVACGEYEVKDLPDPQTSLDFPNLKGTVQVSVVE